MIDLFITVFIWGFSFALSKKALNSLTPFELVTARLALGALTGFVLLGFARTKAAKSDPKTPLILGVFEFGGMYLLYTWSLRFLPSGVVGTLTLMTPAFTYLVAALFRVDRFRWRAVFAVLLSIVGAAMCLPIERIFSSFKFSDSAFGCFLIIASNLSFAIGNVFLAQLKNKSWSPHATFRAQAVGAVLGLVTVLVTPHTDLFVLLRWSTWLLPVYLGVVATGIGFFLWNRGVRKVSATPASVIGNFKAPLSLIWGAVLLGEPLSGSLVVGMLLLMAATILLRLAP